ncbi:2'-5' RNA ligase family protein [Streptomyces sp. NPDC059373]
MPVHESASSAAFPAEPPPSLTEPLAIAEHDWNAFSAVPEMRSHWDRPGWDADARRFYWFLTVDAPAVAELAERCQRPLGGLAFDLVPPESLHITIARLGDVNRVSSSTLESAVEAARVRCSRMSPFVVRAIPIAGSRGAVRMSLAPWKPLWDLHSAVSEANNDAGLGRHRTTRDFRPHLGVAYCNQTTDAALVRKEVLELRTLPSQEFLVENVRLVELRREDRAYRWNVLHTVGLGCG